MSESQPRRSSKVIDPNASLAARLGFELRQRRREEGLTQRQLAALIGFSVQHISEVELADATMSPRFVAACDLALNARGGLLEFLPLVICERALHLQRESLVRQRAEGALSDAEWEALAGTLELGRYAGQQYLSAAGARVDLSRRNILEAGFGAVLGLGTPLAITGPVSSGAVDPELVGHWTKLLELLDQHRAMFGPGELLGTVQHELGIIDKYREVAGGEMSSRLLCVEARWSGLASWLGHDAGSPRIGDYWADRAVRLAQEASYQDMVAWMLMRQSLMHQRQRDRERPDPKQAIAFAQAAGHTSGVSDQIRAICALREAQAHALANDVASSERSLLDAHGILERLGTDDNSTQHALGRNGVTRPYVLAAEARCWLQLRPSRAITMLEAALHLWPRGHVCGRSVHQARLGRACAGVNEPERAAAEGIKALDVVRSAKSDVAVWELKQLGRDLSRFDTPAVVEFREALAGV